LNILENHVFDVQVLFVSLKLFKELSLTLAYLTTSTLNLKVISKEASEIPVQIFSLNGQKVYDQKLAITNGLNEAEISLNHLNDGLYISHIVIAGKAEVIKFSVNK
jgi:hypothetical protein